MRSRILEALSDAPDEQIALRDESASLSFAALRDIVSTQAQWLHSHRVARCALIADNGLGWVTADLALMRLRALNVPVPVWFTSSQVEHVLRDAAIDSILTDDPDGTLRDHADFFSVGVLPDSRLTLLRREVAANVGLPADVVKVTYTSGSTGQAKGVCLALDEIEQVASSIAQAVPSGMTRHLCTMPLATLLENIAGVYVPLLMHTTSIVPSTRRTGVNYRVPDANAFLAAVSEANPTSLILVPELLRLLVSAAKRGWRPPADLKFIAVGGARVSPLLLDDAASLGLPAFEGYGLSECASVVCLNTPGAARRHSVGKPLPHASVRIDSNGQILVRGATMSGYLGQPSSGEPYIATGDLGSIDADGYVYVHGRAKNMFITSMGRNISPEWVESELSAETAIGRAVVIGEARPHPIALIVPASVPVTAQHIDQAIARANSRLPVYAQVRRHSILPEPLTFDAGLLTANGRPRRDAIAQRYATLIDELYDTALAS